MKLLRKIVTGGDCPYSSLRDSATQNLRGNPLIPCDFCDSNKPSLQRIKRDSGL